MNIVIEFDSIWQNSFLSGHDNQKISKDNKRDFNATSIDSAEKKVITKNTVLGVLSRLIGDQRKLYDARSSNEYYFKNLEKQISWKEVNKKDSLEIAFIVNKSNSRPPQSTYLGTISEEEKLFFSKTAPILWSVLNLGIDELLNFIVSNRVNVSHYDSRPDNLLKRIDAIQNFDNLILMKDSVINTKLLINKKKEFYEKKEVVYNKISSPSLKQEKSFLLVKVRKESEVNKLKEDLDSLLNNEENKIFDTKLQVVLDYLLSKYPELIYLDKGKIIPIRLYSIALYLQATRMLKDGLDVDYCINKDKIQIQGFSKRGFNGVRDFLNLLAGSNKKTVGTPIYLTKANGTLEITLGIPREKAKELKQLIENAGVSSFYLGKKGLAYVTNIDTREVG